MSKEGWYEGERAGHGLYPSNTPLTSYASKSLKLSLIYSDFWPRNNTLSVAARCVFDVFSKGGMGCSQSSSLDGNDGVTS